MYWTSPLTLYSYVTEKNKINVYKHVFRKTKQLMAYELERIGKTTSIC